MLGAPAVIVIEGGVGRPIDEIVLNAALFERHGVHVAGAIVNKVDLDAKPGLARTLERGLARHGIPLLGVLPYRPILSNPTLAMVLEGVHGETIQPRPGPRPGHRRRRHRGDGARAHAPADRAAQPGHRARRPGGRDRRDRRRRGAPSGRTGRRRRAGPGADRRLPARASGPRRHPPGRPVRDARPGGHVRRSPPRSTTCWSRRTPSDAGKIAEIKALVWEYLFIDRVLGVAAVAPG